MEINPQASAAKLELAHLLNKQRRLIEAYDLAVQIVRAEPKNARAFAVLVSAIETCRLRKTSSLRYLAGVIGAARTGATLPQLPAVPA